FVSRLSAGAEPFAFGPNPGRAQPSRCSSGVRTQYQAPSSACQPLEPDHYPPSMAESLRLFLIEDDDDIALLIRKSLERVNHHVTGCRTAADALIVLAHSQFDLVLLDQILPDRSGLDLLQTLTREGITAPVLMVTAHGDEQLATRVLRAGALDYIVKDAG